MKYKFEDLIFNITEKKKPVEEDKYNYIGLEHLESGNLFISKWGSDTAPEGEKIVMKKGDVLFGKRRAYQKKVAISPIDGIFSAHGMVLRPKEDVICKEFLPFFISSEAFLNEAIRISVGGLSPTVNWKDIKELEFDLPPLAEQKVLAEKLWAAYEVKQSYLKMIDATDEMVKAQFVEMFKSEDNYEPLENVVVVKDDCRKPINDGVRGSMKEGELYPYYGATGVVDYINDYITDEELLCIAEDCGNYKAGEDSSYIINGKAWVNNHAHLVKAKECCEIKYLHQYLKITDLMPYVSGTTRLKLTQKKMKEIPVLLPSIELQNKFVTIAEQADKSISELRKSVDAIDKVIKSLINENL
jgi:type I restriction enzyme S subunit